MTALTEEGIDSPFDEDIAPMLWSILASCLGSADPDLFFSERSSDVRKAKEMCMSCPVRLQCLSDNLTQPYGVFGGLTDRERKKVAKCAQ